MQMSRPAGTLEPSRPQKFLSRCVASRVPMILLTDEASGHTCGEDMHVLLEQLSQAARSSNPRPAIEAVLANQDVDASLGQAEIFFEGSHVVSGTIAIACGNARVEAKGGGLVIALGRSRVRAHDTFEVWATDDVSLDAYDDVRVHAAGRCRVNSYDKVIGVARDFVHGTMRGQSQWTIQGTGCFFDSLDHCEVRAESGTVRGYGRSRIHAAGDASVSLYESANGWLQGLVQAMVSGNAMAYTTPSVTVSVSGNARTMPLMAAA